MKNGFYKKIFNLLFCAALFLFLPLKGYGVDNLDEDELAPKVVVSAQRASKPNSRSAENILVITEEDIESLPAKDVGDLLRYFPGVDLQLNGLFGQSTSLSIHGSDSRQVLFMVDDIPFNTQLSGQANPTQISLEHVKRVEIIKGASSSAWGSSLGGVINVITKDAGVSEKMHGTFTSSFAEFATTQQSLELSGDVDNMRYFFSGNYLNSDGPKDVTDIKSTNGFGKLSYAFNEEMKIVGSFGYTQADVLYGTTNTNTINSQPYNTRYGKLLFQYDNEETVFNLAYKINDQDFTTDFINASTRAVNFSTVSHNLYQGISINSSWTIFDRDLLVAGADFDWHRLKSNNFLSSAKDISMQAPYVNYTLSLEHWDFIPGVRYDNNDQFGSQVSPSLGIIYHFDNEQKTLVRTKISRAFNAPPLLWIFNDDPAFLVGPNPDLKAERAIVYELGLETELFSSFAMELNLHRSEVKDAIGLRQEGGVFIRDNFRKFRRQGVELILNYQLTEHVRFYTSGAFNDVENRETKETVRDQGVTRQRFTFGTLINDWFGFNAHLFGYYNRFNSPPSLQPNDRKPIFDFKISKAFKQFYQDMDLQIFFNIHNITNSKYWSSITFPLPQRYFEGGFSLSF